MNMFSTLWNFIGFLGIIILILVLIFIIMSISDAILINARQTILKNKAMKESQKEAQKIIKKAILDEIKEQIKLSRENGK